MGQPAGIGAWLRRYVCRNWAGRTGALQALIIVNSSFYALYKCISGISALLTTQSTHIIYISFSSYHQCWPATFVLPITIFLVYKFVLLYCLSTNLCINYKNGAVMRAGGR